MDNQVDNEKTQSQIAGVKALSEEHLDALLISLSTSSDSEKLVPVNATEGQVIERRVTYQEALAWVDALFAYVVHTPDLEYQKKIRLVAAVQLVRSREENRRKNS